MKVPERAAQAWSLLIFAARNRQTLTYELLGKLTGMHAAGLGTVLEPIQSYCLIEKLPPLPALVVSKTTGLPGVGFIAAKDVPREFIRIFEYYWLARGCPSTSDLAEAVKIRPSNGASAVDDAAISPNLETLEALADEALAEHRAGRTLPLDPDTM